MSSPCAAGCRTTPPAGARIGGPFRTDQTHCARDLGTAQIATHPPQHDEALLPYDLNLVLPEDQFMWVTKALVATVLCAASACAVAADARDRSLIRQGTAEGEVLFRIGKPDHEAFVLDARGRPEEKTWTYFPHARDPQTLTIITLRAGVVANVERKIAR